MAQQKPKTFGGRGKAIHRQARELISKVITFMKMESEGFQRTGGPSIPITHYKQRAISAMGISERMYKTILKEMAAIQSGASSSFSSPRRKRSRSSSPDDLEEAPPNDFDFKDETWIKPDIDIEENDIKPTIIEGNLICDACHRTQKQNDDLKEEVKRLNSVVEELNQKLEILRQKEIQLERTVQSVREIVNTDLERAVALPEVCMML